jgi:DNA-binding SARP family transcriptional activator
VAGVEFRLLGELEVLAGGEPIALGGAKQRALLALLLLERGRAVSTDRLIDAIWSGRAPATAQKSIQVYVSGLRKALGDDRTVTRGRGYEFVVQPGEVDVDAFDDLVRDANTAPPEVVASRLRDALALVRGRPLADLALEPWAAPEVARLEDRVLAATEARIEAELALGRHAVLVPELEALVEQHPYREHLLELVMLALYRSGRQGNALEAYRRGAARLRDELGLEPSRPLQQLEASILQQDEALDPPPEAQRDLWFTRRRRSWKLITAGAVVVLAAAAAATGIALTRSSSASLASLPPGVAIVSAKDGSLVAHISTAEINVPSEVVKGNGHFWVWGLHPFQLVEVDPADGHLIRHVNSPFSGDAAWYLPDGRNVWFTANRELVRVDAVEGRAVDRYILRSANTTSGLAMLTRCFGSLWVVDNPDSLVPRVDPATGRVRARIPTQYPYAIACGDGGLWVSWFDKGIHRIDPATNTIVAGASTPALFVNEVAVGARHIRGVPVHGNTISFTLTRSSKTFLDASRCPFFSTVPADTPAVHGGLTDAPPSAGPYFMSEGLNGEYHILKRNPNYAGSRPARFDAIAFREGISPEHAVARVRSGTWDGALLADELLAPGGDVARQAKADPHVRTEELPARNLGLAFAGAKGWAVHALLSSRLGCDTIEGALDLRTLCLVTL